MTSDDTTEHQLAKSELGDISEIVKADNLIFAKVLATKQPGIDETLNQLAEATLEAEAASEAVTKKTRYVVVMSDEVHKAIDSKALKFDVDKKGRMFAQIRGKKGQFSDKFPIEKELEAHGIDPLEAANALQLKAIQSQLEDMAQELDEIGSDVTAVIQGQQNDRLGLYYAGLNLYLESREVQDESLRKLIAAQALKTLGDANAQMTLEIQEDIRYLSEKRYLEKKKNGQVADLKGKVDDISRCFEVIHHSAVLKAAIYYEENELPAMLVAVNEYAGFLGKVIAPNADKLTEYDEDEKMLRGGVWERRSESLMEVETLKQRLSSCSSFYLEAADDKTGGEDYA